MQRIRWEVIKNYVALLEDYGFGEKNGEREESPWEVSRALNFSFHGRVCFVFKRPSGVFTAI